MKQHNYFSEAEPVTLEQMLDARERRAAAQRQLLERFACPLISFTLNIPGEYKAYPLARKAFEQGLLLIARQLERQGLAALYEQQTRGNTGYEYLAAVDADGASIKSLMIAIEEGHPLGRLFDMDVFDRDGVLMRGAAYGRVERPCLICGGPVWACARSRAHSGEELAYHTAKRIEDYLNGEYADKIAACAQKALLYEVAVTPKPGLVDRANNGAHTDMDIFTFIDSACVLTPYFRACTIKGLTFHGEPEALFAALRYPGMQAEDAMLTATAGVNTHKGLIFSLGLVCAALGFLHKTGEADHLDALVRACGRMAGAALDELHSDSGTHGIGVYQKYGLTGVRGEAANGFPHARLYGLPILRRIVGEGYSLNDAGAAALLHLIAHVPDTNILHRSDKSTQEEISHAVTDFLHKDPSPEQMLNAARTLDRKCICRNISPGGCADLLAVSFMLFFCFPE